MTSKEFQDQIIRTKEMARIKGRKGGLVKSKKKRIVNALKNRKKCTASCPLYPCLYQVLSDSDELQGKCAVKQLPFKMQERVFGFLMKGEQAILKYYTELLLKAAQRDLTENNRQSFIDAVRVVENYMRIVFGEKSSISADIRQEQKLSTKEMMKIIKRAIDENKSANKA